MVISYVPLVYLLILLACIILPLFIPARLKKVLWILPGLMVLIIASLGILNGITTGFSGEREATLAILGSIVLLPVTFMASYYIKLLFLHLKEKNN